MSVYSNIWKLYIIKALRWFLLAMPIAVIFFQDNGLSLSEVMTLQGIYSLTIAIMEIPSGFLADRFGRKQTLVFGTFFSFFGFLIISTSFDFWPFLFGELLLGVGASFISGADSALLYDSLLESNKKELYTKMEGRTYGIGNLSEALAGICGGLLADISLRLPWGVQTCVAALAIPIALTLVEPKMHSINQRAFNLKSIWNILKFCILENKLLKWLIIFSSITGLATLSLAWFAQPYFKSINMPIAYFGFVWAILNLSTGFASFNAHYFEKKWSNNQLLLFICLGISLPIIFIVFASPIVGLCLILMVFLIRGIATPTLRQFINELTPSDVRATVLSIRSFTIRLSFSIVAPFLGWVFDNYSIKESLFLLGIGVLIVGMVSTRKLIKLPNQ